MTETTAALRERGAGRTVSAAPTDLTRRASLTAVASLLDYTAKAVVNLVLTPILVGGLGSFGYGTWQMLSRFGGYMSAADGRPTQALRLIIAQHQHDSDDALRRRFVGGALVVWLCMLPLVLTIGTALSLWIAPALTKAPAALRGTVQLTAALLVLCFLLEALAEVPESVLRGMNLGYKRMGLQASLNVLGGGLAALAVWHGLGLAGVGGSQVIRALATGVCFWLLVRKFVRWFGIARPRRADIRAVFGMSVWIAAGDLIAKLLLSSDVLVLGAVLGPAIVTTYALTGYAAQTAIGIHLFVADAAMPGVGGLLGRGETVRAARARHELQLLCWLFVTCVGTTILLWNHAFLGLWVGASHYAGVTVDLLIVLLTAQTIFIRTDAYIIDAALQPKRRVVVGAAGAALTLALATPLTHLFGLVGLCAGLLAGRSVQSIAYPLLARAQLGRSRRSPDLDSGLARPLLTTGALFAAAALVGHRLSVSNWPVWGLGVGSTLVAAAAVALGAGLNARTRRVVVARIASGRRWRRGA